MINHARNLLMNVKQGGFASDYPGEEYIPETFVPKKLSPSLRLVRHLLFGESPDRLFLNYRMRQLMMLLHSTELASYVYDLDPRVTYLPFSNAELFENTFGLTIKQLSANVTQQPETGTSFLQQYPWNIFFQSFATTDGSTSTTDTTYQVVDDEDIVPLYVRGTYTANASHGRIEQFWDVIVTSPTTVRVDNRRQPYDSVEHVLDYSKGLCTAIPLTGTGLSLQFHPVNTGTRWQIMGRARPDTDLGILLAHIELTLGSRGDQEIFPARSSEPVATFERIWRHHELAAYRYSALLLAMIWQLDAAPQQEAL